MHLAKNIKYLRKSVKGWTQTQLGERIQKEKTSIASYESGRREPPLSIVSKLAEVLDVSIDDLVHKDLSDPDSQQQETRMKKSSLEYAQDIENDKMTVDELEAEIGQINMQKVFRLMELRINELEMALKDVDPELAKRLKIE